MYKKSIYNYCEKKEGNTIIFNGVSNCCVIVNDREFYEYDNLIEGNNYEAYIRMGFYVKKELNEIDAFLKKCIYYQEKKHLLYLRVYTTTFCNAACEYCYEKSISHHLQMSHDMADKIYDFIVNKYDNHDSICIEWFGGEPLLNKGIITYLSDRVNRFSEKKHIKYWSRMVSNGSLMQKVTAEEYRLWKLTHIQVTLDGTRQYYEKIKKYSDKTTYETVINNIKYVLLQGIKVTIRINYSDGNISECIRLIEELNVLFPKKDNLSVYCKRIMSKDTINSINDSVNTDIFLFDLCYKNGFIKSIEKTINCRLIGCVASKKDAYMVTPDGFVGKCSQAIAENGYIGSVSCINKEKESNWISNLLDDDCLNCKLLPLCNGGCLYEKKSNKDYCSINRDFLAHKLQMILDEHLLNH